MLSTMADSSAFCVVCGCICVCVSVLGVRRARTAKELTRTTIPVANSHPSFLPRVLVNNHPRTHLNRAPHVQVPGAKLREPAHALHFPPPLQRTAAAPTSRIAGAAVLPLLF